MARNQGVLNVGMARFYSVWFGDTVSMVGTNISMFAIGVYIYKLTGSVTLFGLVALLSTLPVAGFSLFSGTIVDRFNRKSIMVWATLCAAFVELVTLVLIVTLDPAKHYPILLITVLAESVADTFVLPAFYASISQLVPKEKTPKVTGLIQLASSFVMVLAPGVSGFLYLTFGIEWVLAVDCITDILAALIIASIRFPEFKPEKTSMAFFRDIGGTLRYIAAKPGVFQLIGLVSVANWLGTYAIVLMSPLLLTVSNAEKMGTIYSIGGFSMIASSLLISLLKQGGNHIRFVFWSLFLFGFGLLLTNAAHNIFFIAAGYCVMVFVVPIIKSVTQAIFTVKIDPAIQGRFFALYRGITVATIPLADATVGQLTHAAEQLSGQGKLYSILLVFLALAGLFMLLGGLGYLSKPLRNIETSLPDVA